MSSDVPPKRRELRFAKPLSALLSDDSVQIFAPEVYAFGAVLCLSACAVMLWTGLISV